MSPGQGAQAEHAPAKINLALHVVGRRADSYHLIESLSVFTDFGDRIIVQPAERDAFIVSGPFAGQTPSGPDNLVLRARDAFRARFPVHAGQTLEIGLDKRIPVASGVGGGSSDAAATLRALGLLFATKAGALDGLAPRLGADVPMCLAARPLIARGIGDIIEAAPDLPVLDLVLVNPGVAVDTPRVFSALDRRDNPPMPPLPARPDQDSLVEWLHATRNDLMVPAIGIAPPIRDALDAIMAEGAAFARMSGSGATCFGLFSGAEQAASAARAIATARPGWFTMATRTGA